MYVHVDAAMARLGYSHPRHTTRLRLGRRHATAQTKEMSPVESESKSIGIWLGHW
jgi:hypothetical protein